MTKPQEALTSAWAEAQMRVQAQSWVLPNVFNVGNVVKQLIWTRMDENEQLDHCKMTDNKGNPEFEDVFLPYEGQSPVSQDKPVFDTGRGGIWIGSYEKGFPIVYLTNGEILLLRSEFEKAKQTVDWSKGRRSSP